MATAQLDKRTRAQVIVDTIGAFMSAGAQSPSNPEEAGAMAARLGVPVALIWLSVDGLTIAQIDQSGAVVAGEGRGVRWPAW